MHICVPWMGENVLASGEEEKKISSLNVKNILYDMYTTRCTKS